MGRRVEGCIVRSLLSGQAPLDIRESVFPFSFFRSCRADVDGSGRTARRFIWLVRTSSRCFLKDSWRWVLPLEDS